MRRGRRCIASASSAHPWRLRVKALFCQASIGSDAMTDSRRRAELPRRGPGARPVAIRGRADLHRGPGAARRRGRQGREPEGRRARPHPRHRPEAGRRRLLLHDLQRQQEIGDGQSEVAARRRAGQGDGDAGRCLYREHGARHDREAGARLGRAARAQPAADLCPGQRASARAARTSTTSPST